MSHAPEITAHDARPWLEDGVLAGIAVGDAKLPFPGCGLETELGVVVHGARGNVRPALQRLLARRTGVVAAVQSESDTAYEADRMFDTYGCSYREGDHLELNTFFRRGAAAARWNLERQLIRAGELAQVDDQLLLHATGGDPFGSSWSSLHVNIAISDRGYDRLLANQRACDVALGYYLPAQLSLAVVDGNGGVAADGFLVSDRTGAFDAVFGTCTLRPHRALVVDRAEGFGNARVMGMLRALSFGRASCTGLLATQLDVLISDLMVHGLVRAEPIRIADPVAAARDLAMFEHRGAAAAMQRQVQSTRRGVVDWLGSQLGAELLEQLLPGVRAELAFLDDTLLAIERDDQRELVERCDWARKRAMLLDHLAGAAWDSALPALQELNVHYARLDDRALRHHWPEAALPPTHRPDPVPAETASWLLHWVCERAESSAEWQQQLGSVEISWQGLRRSIGGWAEPQGGAWPWAERRCQSIQFAPYRFARAATEPLLADVDDVDDLFLALGEQHSHFGDYAGRAYGPDHRGASTSDPYREN